MKKYQTDFESSFERLSRLDHLLDDGILQRIGHRNETSFNTVPPVSLFLNTDS